MITSIDHVVLTTTRPEACIDFYTRILGMRMEVFVDTDPPRERRAFHFGQQKINLHVQGAEFSPRAHLPVPGSQDWCFISSVPIGQVVARLQEAGWPILEGPVDRAGATGALRSVYVRDPDLNLIEIAEKV